MHCYQQWKKIISTSGELLWDRYPMIVYLNYTKQDRVADLLCFFACVIETPACVFHLYFSRMHCTTVHDPTHGHTSDVSPSVLLSKFHNIQSVRRTLDMSSRNRCCNCTGAYPGGGSESSSPPPLCLLYSTVAVTDLGFHKGGFYC